jgi:hypothetical protein
MILQLIPIDNLVKMRHDCLISFLPEVVGAFTSVIMIWIVTGILVYMAFERVMSQEFEIKVEVMLITSAIGVASCDYIVSISYRKRLKLFTESNHFIP